MGDGVVAGEEIYNPLPPPGERNAMKGEDLLRPERDHGINRGCATGGQVGGCGDGQQQNEHRASQGERVQGAHSKQRRGLKTSGGQCQNQTQSHANGGQAHGVAQNQPSGSFADAPSAMRMPISRRRCVTRKARNP